MSRWLGHGIIFRGEAVGGARACSIRNKGLGASRQHSSRISAWIRRSKGGSTTPLRSGSFVPGTKTPSQLSREFLGQLFRRSRSVHCIEVDVSDLAAIKGREGVSVVSDDLPLDLNGQLIGNGEVPLR
ncbi:hypothetical protein DCO49_00350 [Stenotrophomonas sp. SPM]|nr:hypothetical protein DCO49_00350 [Stenotrophomonas sp. SPM]